MLHVITTINDIEDESTPNSSQHGIHKKIVFVTSLLFGIWNIVFASKMYLSRYTGYVNFIMLLCVSFNPVFPED